MRRLTACVLAAASLSSYNYAHFANVWRESEIVMVGSMVSWEVKLLIAKRLPFVRFVMGLITVGEDVI
jgi:hypothetical protein